MRAGPAWLLAGFAALPFDGPVRKPVDICPPAKLEEPSGVVYHPERRSIFAVRASNHEGRPGKLFELDADGEVLRELLLPGERQEGFCLDALGRAYVACDSGGILRVDPARD